VSIWVVKIPECTSCLNSHPPEHQKMPSKSGTRDGIPGIRTGALSLLREKVGKPEFYRNIADKSRIDLGAMCKLCHPIGAAFSQGPPRFPPSGCG